MPITCEFEYHKPKSLPEAIKILSRDGKNASVLAGGTDLLVWMKEGLRAPSAVVDVKGIGELHSLEASDGSLLVGACVTFTELLESAVVRGRLPLLWECARTVASVGVRNRATLVGNICSAVPCLDSAPALLAYEASVVGEGPAARRRIPLPDRKNGACYVKLGRYRGEDLAQVGVGVLALEDREYRIAFCAVAPAPARATRIERLLNGRDLSEDLIHQARDLVSQEIRPITDIRASKEYRSEERRAGKEGR